MFEQFFKSEAAGGILLLAVTVLALLTANARTTPLCTLDMTEGMLAKAASICPPMTSPMAAGAPL